MRVLVGSANFTRAAYTRNVELCVQLDGKRSNPQLAQFRQFVDDQWSKASQIDEQWLLEYTEAFDRARRQPVIPVPRAALELSSIESLKMSWADYVARINGQEGRKAGPKFTVSVRGPSPSYFDELEAARRLFARQPSLAKLSQSERLQLIGVGKGSNGLLGSMNSALDAKALMRDEPEAIGATLDRLPLEGTVGLDTARDLLSEMTALKGVKLGVATRLFAIKRPDLFVSVNNGSNPQLAKLLGGKPIGSVGQYIDLMHVIWATEWHGSDRPSDIGEAAIWDRRAALLDAALYQAV